MATIPDGISERGRRALAETEAQRVAGEAREAAFAAHMARIDRIKQRLAALAELRRRHALGLPETDTDVLTELERRLDIEEMLERGPHKYGNR